MFNAFIISNSHCGYRAATKCGFRTLVVLVVVLVLGMGSPRVRSESFGMHFLGNTTSLVSGFTGVVPMTNWNNISNTVFTAGNIHSSDGLKTATLTMSGSGRTGWNNGTSAEMDKWGQLLEATNAEGSWTTNLSATSPLFVTPDQPQKFFRVFLS